MDEHGFISSLSLGGIAEQRLKTATVPFEYSKVLYEKATWGWLSLGFFLAQAFARQR